jgi:hypothetical protein
MAVAGMPREKKPGVNLAFSLIGPSLGKSPTILLALKRREPSRRFIATT